MKLQEFFKSNWKYFVKYSIVGAVGTLIDVAGFAALLAFTPLNRFIAATISFIAAVINNFTFNKIWTFHDHSTAVTTQFTKFFIVSVGGLILNLTFLWIWGLVIAYLIKVTSADLPVWANTLAKLGASAVVLIYNFLMNRFWTFKPEAEAK